MIKKINAVIIINIFCLSMFVACSSNITGTETSSVDTANKEYTSVLSIEESIDGTQIVLSLEEAAYDGNVLIGDYGGDEKEMFYFPFNGNYTGIPIDFYYYIGEDKVNEWKAQLKTVDFGNGNMVRLDFNICNFLVYCGISKEEFRQIYTLPYYEEYDIGYTDEMLDALYSNDTEALHRLFRNPYAAFYNGKVYTPAWVASHSYEDYVKEGLPIELVSEMTEKSLRDNRFTADMKRVEAKVNAGLAVDLPENKKVE